jgi:anaerobic ribonucleoside-triphosphate reductase activating protein
MDNLNIYRICEKSSALGPGTRFVIWVQGCLQHCEGCITPQSRSLEINHLISVETLAKAVIDSKNIEGITISGGEPFLQAKNLARLLDIVKANRPDLNVIVFSGYKMEQLLSDSVQKLLHRIDLLIDGPYIEELNDGKGLRGSSNQRLHFLTDKLLPFKEQLRNGGRNNEVILEAKGMHIVGIPRKDINIKNHVFNNQTI